MAKRGRKPNLSRAARGIVAPGDRWDCPGHLSGVAREAWGHLVGLLREAGNLDRCDPTIVEAYSINVALLREAHRALAEDGAIVINGMGAPAPNPAVSMINTATMRIKAICYDLGLVPATSKFSADKAVGSSDSSKWGDLIRVV